MKEALNIENGLPAGSSLSMIFHDGVTGIHGGCDSSRNDNDDGQDAK